MKTVGDRIDFAIRLATLDFDMLRAGDWLNLREDLEQFLVGERGQEEPLRNLGGILVSPLHPPLPKEFPEEEFLMLQGQTRAILFRIAQAQMPADRARVWEVKPIELKSLRFSVIPVQSSALISTIGSVRDTFLIKLIFLLGQQPLGKILLCPTCNTIFSKKGKQKYCSRTCVNRASQRRFVESKKATKRKT